jgi:hypothetical protein
MFSAKHGERAMRGVLLFGLGIVVGVVATMLWPKSTFEQCMLDKIHDPSPELFRAAYRLCKDLPKHQKL